MQILTCIGCPIGCELTVCESEVKGQECKIGETYGREEATNPTRNIATSIRVENGDMDMLSVKVSRPIPKAKIMECVKAVHKIKAQAPVNVGDIVLEDVAGTGVDMVATRVVNRVD